MSLNINHILQGPVLRKYPARLSVTSFTCFFGMIQFLAIAAFVETDRDHWKIQSGGELLTILYAVIFLNLSDPFFYIFELNGSMTKRVILFLACLFVGSCSIWNLLFSSDMVHWQRGTPFCSCFPTCADSSCSHHGISDTWWSVIFWRVCVLSRLFAQFCACGAHESDQECWSYSPHVDGECPKTSQIIDLNPRPFMLNMNLS